MDYSSNAIMFDLFTNNDVLRVVKVLFQFCRIGEIDTINEKFQAEIYIECTWIDKHVKSDYNPKTHWNPDVYIENGINLTHDIAYRLVKLNDNLTEITETRYVKGEINN